MFDNAAFETVIGLIFVYLLYSLLGSLLQEIVATNIGLRGYVLKKAIKRMLDDDNSVASLSKAFINHPSIKYLSAGSSMISKFPSYIDKKTFAKVIIDMLRGDSTEAAAINESVKQCLDTGQTLLDSVGIQRETLTHIKSLWVAAGEDVERFRTELEGWFDEMMSRSSGWYKRYTQIILLSIGFTIAVIFNVDTIKIARNLQQDPQARVAILNQASAFVKNSEATMKEIQRSKAIRKDTTGEDSEAKLQELEQLNQSLLNKTKTLIYSDIPNSQKILAIGWDGGFAKNFDITSVIGWILSALAISMGAPFWFDLLNKVMKLKSSVASAEKEEKK